MITKGFNLIKVWTHPNITICAKIATRFRYWYVSGKSKIYTSAALGLNGILLRWGVSIQQTIMFAIMGYRSNWRSIKAASRKLSK